MTAAEPLSGVARTALGVARMRAAEQARPDRLFDDPYAQAFVDAAPDTLPRHLPAPGSLPELMAFQAVVRTRFYDDYLLASCGEGGRRQVVLLAAGLDTRAYRLPWPDGVRLYEVDLPEIFAFKEGLLAGVHAAPSCTRFVCPADLRGDWPRGLIEAGFSPDEPTVWLLEGLLIYLDAARAAALLTTVGVLSAPGSRLSAESGDNVGWLREKAREVPTLARAASLWKGGLGDGTAGWLERHGWRTEPHTLAAVAGSYGRPAPDGVRSGFLTATWAPD
ncbi:SAM-dependent methyltransferase [Spirillospora sp. NPDC048911]|uniref:SAM-dependent methyltransferase n=1 Tax=Spirillospora sp. NPDC048911 TaxID=3364527 RepID=UPI00371ECE1A